MSADRSVRVRVDDEVATAAATPRPAFRGSEVVVWEKGYFWTGENYHSDSVVQDDHWGESVVVFAERRGLRN